MNPHTSTEHARLYHADLRQWSEVIAPGTVVLGHIDGPYDLRKADWDCLTDARKSYAGIPGEADRAVRAYLDLLELLSDRRGADLVAWYAPILHTISEASAASSSAYLWNTDAGEALLRPVMMALGWTFRGRVTWFKTGAHPALIGAASAGEWPDVTEACGFYHRGGHGFVNPGAVPNVWALGPASEMGAERIYSSEMVPHRVHGTSQRVGLHPCQKPLVFADRVIRASSRPGDLVVDWFGGTCRPAVANARLSLSERRQVVAFELDRRYLDAVAPSLSFVAAPAGVQPSLFGGAP